MPLGIYQVQIEMHSKNTERSYRNSIFFDIDKNSDQEVSLPHMLPKKNDWEKIVSGLGINNNDHIIVYVNSDVLSACRCWFTFFILGTI